MTVTDEATEAVLADVVELRRAIHRHPELGTDNPATQQRILDALADLHLDVRTGDAITSVVADLVGDRPGPIVLLRADTDALPMTEESGELFSSEVEGRAHACGHDAHVAMLVGAARVLAASREELAGTVRFMFQPGEEGFGGAAVMIDEGVLDGVSSAFAIHISPNVPTGFLAGRAGPLMAATDDFEVIVKGSGGHASTPHFGNDPIPVVCEMVTALETFVTRRIDAFDPAVLTVGRISGGTTTNVIAETASFAGTIRTMSEATRSKMRAGFERVVRGIASAHECEVSIDLVAGYPVTRNDVGVTQIVAGVARDVLGAGRWFELPSPIMGAEDFSYVAQRVPAAMAFLGACPPDILDSLSAPSCHSNLMRLDEAALGYGVRLHVAMADALLARAAADEQ